MPGYKDWVDGVALPAADMDDYISKQVVLKLASVAARDAAITGAIKREGMIVYRDDGNVLEVSRDGTAGNYSTIGPVHGAPTSWTPVITQSNTPTFTNNLSWYSRVGRMVTGAFSLTLTSSGTASNTITVSFPVTAATGVDAVGSGYFSDSSGNLTYPLIVAATSTTAMLFLDTAANSATANLLLGSGSSSFTAALATGDRLTGTFCYPAAADA